MSEPLLRQRRVHLCFKSLQSQLGKSPITGLLIKQSLQIFSDNFETAPIRLSYRRNANSRRKKGTAFSDNDAGNIQIGYLSDLTRL